MVSVSYIGYSLFLDKLSGALEDARANNLVLSRDYKEPCPERDAQLRILEASRDVAYYFHRGVDQEEFNATLNALEESVLLLKGSRYHGDQRRRLHIVIRMGLSQESPKLMLS